MDDVKRWRSRKDNEDRLFYYCDGLDCLITRFSHRICGIKQVTEWIVFKTGGHVIGKFGSLKQAKEFSEQLQQ